MRSAYGEPARARLHTLGRRCLTRMDDNLALVRFRPRDPHPLVIEPLVRRAFTAVQLDANDIPPGGHGAGTA